jgi:hypothetical protein
MDAYLEVDYNNHEHSIQWKLQHFFFSLLLSGLMARPSVALYVVTQV